MAPFGLLGGTFDPIHFGHLRLAQEMLDALGLARVLLIPAGRPPHRRPPQATPEQRLEMARLATAGNPLLQVDSREVFKPTPCFTVETLTDLRREVGASQPLVLILGTDAFLGLPAWHRWREIFTLAHVAVASRPDGSGADWQDAMSPELREEWDARHGGGGADLAAAPAGRVVAREIPFLDISATRIRELLRECRSPRYLLPDAVLDYIRRNLLYSEQG